MRFAAATIFLGTTITLLSGSLSASTTYTASSSFAGPGQTVTYTEIVGPASNPPHPPSITEHSSPCMLNSGCTLGSFSVTLPTVVVPTGDYVTSATLDLYYSFTLGGSPLTEVSVTPIIPGSPTTAGTAGSHYEDILVTFGTAVGSLVQTGGPSTANLTGTNYTTAVHDAFLQGKSLAPITVSQDLLYGFMTAQSADGGQNSNTTFQQTFDLSSASLNAVLTVNVAPVPEPSTFGLLGVAFAAAIMLSRRLV